MGWAILAGVMLVIAGIFLITRLVTPHSDSASPSNPAIASSTATVAAPATPSANAAQPLASTADPQVVDLASMNQPARRAFVLKLISQGVFTGVQATTSPPKVGVTPLFQGLNLSLKQQFIAAVEAYVHNGAATTQPLELIDATNGNSIGTYTVADGLKLL
jgi:hypothetical protein